MLTNMCVQLGSAHEVTTTAQLAALEEAALAQCFQALELSVPKEAAKLCLAWLVE
jgi:hypothetical protein